LHKVELSTRLNTWPVFISVASVGLFLLLAALTLHEGMLPLRVLNDIKAVICSALQWEVLDSTLSLTSAFSLTSASAVTAAAVSRSAPAAAPAPAAAYKVESQHQRPLLHQLSRGLFFSFSTFKFKKTVFCWRRQSLATSVVSRALV
jgi:hypothetical protein